MTDMYMEITVLKGTIFLLVFNNSSTSSFSLNIFSLTLNLSLLASLFLKLLLFLLFLIRFVDFLNHL